MLPDAYYDATERRDDNEAAILKAVEELFFGSTLHTQEAIGRRMTELIDRFCIQQDGFSARGGDVS
jgi:hypothetical protein